MKEDLETLLNEIFQNNSLVSGVLSSPLAAMGVSKIEIRPIYLKGALVYQWTEMRQNQAFHSNKTVLQCQAALQENIPKFKQSLLRTEELEYQILVNKKGAMTILRKSSTTKSKLPLQHNRQKQYLLEEGMPIPFLIELGVMNKDGKVYHQMRDKFRQINRFIEMVKDILPALADLPELRIVDFGCGKAYLTFSLYYYLHVTKGLKVNMVGVDLKTDVLQKCQQLADKLEYSGLKFVHGGIKEYQGPEQVDMMVALHACDTASDDALARAVAWQCKVILCAPCCQHEIYKQITNQELAPLLEHGILKERFASLVTDAARAKLLEAWGYQVQVIEFIETEHTPKNVLIRAVKKEKETNQNALSEYLTFKKTLNIKPTLEKLLGLVEN